MAYALLISTEDVKRFTILNGNLDVDDFIQYIKIAQDITIQNYLGTKLYDKINDGIVAGNLAVPYTTLLSKYIKPMVIHWAMVEYLPFAAYTIANKGVYKHDSENATTVEKNEVDFLVEKQRQIAQHYTQRFVDYINFNTASFPEYNSNSNGDMYPRGENNLNGWYL